MSSYRKKGEWLEIHFDKRDAAKAAAQLDGSFADEMSKGWRSVFPIMPALADRLERNGGVERVGDRLRLRLFPPESPQFPPDWTELDILYEDDFSLVVNKPPGIAVHPDSEGQMNTLANAVAGYYLQTGQASSVRHIHRLDVNTSGPVLYAKNEYAQQLFDEAMRAKKIDRSYVAIAHGIIKKKRGVLDYPIGRDRHHKQRRRVSSTGVSAVTSYEVLGTSITGGSMFPSGVSLVRLRLETGRTHQIRVHLSHAGHPIVGDDLYGGENEFMPRQALHGESLTFLHPLSHREVQVDAPLADDMRELMERLLFA